MNSIVVIIIILFSNRGSGCCWDADGKYWSCWERKLSDNPSLSWLLLSASARPLCIFLHINTTTLQVTFCRVIQWSMHNYVYRLMGASKATVVASTGQFPVLLASLAGSAAPWAPCGASSAVGTSGLTSSGFTSAKDKRFHNPSCAACLIFTIRCKDINQAVVGYSRREDAAMQRIQTLMFTTDNCHGHCALPPPAGASSAP